MHTIQSIIICGDGPRSLALARACADAGIHPTLLVASDEDGASRPLTSDVDVHRVSNPFDGIADMVIDLAEDSDAVIIARFNLLAEINHSDVVFILEGEGQQLDRIAAQVMHPGRVIGIRWPNVTTGLKHTLVHDSVHTTAATKTSALDLIATMGFQLIASSGPAAHDPLPDPHQAS